VHQILRQTACVALAAIAAAAMVIGLRAENPKTFKPDGVFKGSALTGWHVLGQADWRAEDGVLIGRAKPGADGGWLVMDKGLQDLMLFANVRCEGPCKAGVLMRAQKAPDGGMRGAYVSLTDNDINSYVVTLDAQGKETGREQIAGGGRAGGGGGGGGRGGRAGGGAGAAPGAPAAGAAAGARGDAAAAGGQGAARAGGGGGGGGGRGRGAAPVTALKPNEWNPVDILVAGDTVRATPGGGGALGENGPTFGSIALYVGGTGEVRFKDVSWKDLNSIVDAPEEVSSRFTMKHVSSFYYGWSAAAADINKDGALDIVSGPFYYLGPSFSERRIYRTDRVYNPATEYAPDMVNFAFDFTGDGWPDILASEFAQPNRPMDLYVNPHGEPRKWDKFQVLPKITSELVVMKDLDGDGKPEIIFGSAGAYAWAHPDPANPTAEWTLHPLATPGEQRTNNHGIGVGDVNGDGRLDIVVPFGWYEQPAKGQMEQPWAFHAASFGGGGGEIGVYDVNGDGLADVVTSLAAHGFGLAWFEQKKAADNSRTFEEHMIADDFSTKNAGDVVFSEPHASRFVDMDGDKIPDFIVGKRYWSHLENYNGEDTYGPAVLYIYRTVRNPKAPGGAEFRPELVHNRSGIGSAFEVIDLNKDGKPDIVVAGAYGTHVFLSKPAAAATAAKKQ
jgi:hypothetical protein